MNVLCVGFCLMSIVSIGSDVNAGNWEKLEPGMTLQEVCELIKLPPGDYRQNPNPHDDWVWMMFITRFDYACTPESTELHWIGSQGRIDVVFGPDGKLKAKRFRGCSK